MGNNILIRAYNVGCGDCIYVRIPDKRDGFHMLIDCGKKGGTELLQIAVKHIEENLLPPGSGGSKKRLDLLVATHRHEDHIKGFDPAFFKNIEVGTVWISTAMDPANKQAKKTKHLHSLAAEQMRSLMERGRALSPQVEALASMFGVSNDQADDFLLTALPKAKAKRQFVHAGMTSKDLGLKLPPDTLIHVLAPEQDIDRFYLGEEADTSLKGFQAASAAVAKEGVAKKQVSATPTPRNINPADFRVLQSRMLSNGLAFAAKDSTIQNNLSIVLLIEWKKRRLLFVGDAEWDREYAEGKDNGSWNVMWEKRKKQLAAPVDFLKIGHHGSTNATPHPSSERPAPKKNAPAPKPGSSVYDILDTLLPVPKAGKVPVAQAIVSTEREFYNPIPECRLLVDLATRISNSKNYGASLKKKRIDPKTIWATPKAKKNKFFETYEQAFLDSPQPLRTDLEFQLTGAGFIDAEIKP